MSKKGRKETGMASGEYKEDSWPSENDEKEREDADKNDDNVGEDNEEIRRIHVQNEHLIHYMIAAYMDGNKVAWNIKH